MKRLSRQYSFWFCCTVVVAGLTAPTINAQEVDPGTSQPQVAGPGAGAADDPGAQTVVLGMTLEEAEGRPKVTDVAAASPAWDAGVRKGDVIQSIDGLEQSSVKSYVDWLDGVRKIVADKKDGQSLAVELSRDGTHLELRARIPESRIEEVREQKKQEELAQQQSLELYPAEQPVPVPQQSVPYPAGGYGDGDVAIAIGNGLGGGGRVGNGGQFGQAMAQLFLVNGGNNMTGGPTDPNQPNQLLQGANPIQQREQGPNNNRTQQRPATIDQRHGDALQQRLESGGQQTAGQGQQGAVQSQQQGQLGVGQQQPAEVEPNRPLQLGTNRLQGRNSTGTGQQIAGQPDGIDDNANGAGGQVGTAMFQDNPGVLVAVVQVAGLPPGNYFVGISDESSIQAGLQGGLQSGVRGGVQGGLQNGVRGGVPQNPVPPGQLPRNQKLNPQQPQQQPQLQQQQRQQPAVRPGAAQPRGNALFDGTKFFANAQVETPDTSPDVSPEGFQAPSPNLEAPSEAGVPGVDPDAAIPDDDQVPDGSVNDPGMDNTGGGAFVRIGMLQVGQNGAGRLRQRIPNVRVDQIVGMAVVVHATNIAPNQATGTQVNMSADGAASLVAAGMIELVHPGGLDPTVQAGSTVGVENTVQQGQQEAPAAQQRPAGQTSDSRIDQ